MATIKLIVTGIGSPTPNPAVASAWLNGALDLVLPFKLVGDTGDLNIGFGLYGYPSLWMYTPDGFLYEDPEEYTYAENVEGMPFRTDQVEFVVPSGIPFNLADFTHVEYSSQTVNGSAYINGYFTDTALWLYVDGVLVADSGNAVLVDVYEGTNGGKPYTIRTMRANLAQTPEVFWTQLKRCSEEP